MNVTIGRIVHYMLSEQDAASINVQRKDYRAFEAGHKHPHEPGQPGATGHQAHYGNDVEAGQTYPALVVRVWGDGTYGNLQVFLDGNDTYWATSRAEADAMTQLGRWTWPTIPGMTATFNVPSTATTTTATTSTGYTYFTTGDEK